MSEALLLKCAALFTPGGQEIPGTRVRTDGAGNVTIGPFDRAYVGHEIRFYANDFSEPWAAKLLITLNVGENIVQPATIAAGKA